MSKSAPRFLYLLLRTTGGYDEVAGMVVSARSRDDAQRLATKNAGGEGPAAWFFVDAKRIGTSSHKRGVVLVDFYAG